MFLREITYIKPKHFSYYTKNVTYLQAIQMNTNPNYKTANISWLKVSLG